MSRLFCFFSFFFLYLFCYAKQDTLSALDLSMMRVLNSFPSEGMGLCSGTITVPVTETEGVITTDASLNPRNYSNKANCLWHINAKPGYQIKVRITFFFFNKKKV